MLWPDQPFYRPDHDRNEPLNMIEYMIVDLLESTDLPIVDAKQASDVSVIGS